MALRPYPGKKNPLGFEKIAVCENCSFGKVVTQLTQSDLDKFYQEGHYWYDAAVSHSTKAHNTFQAEMRVTAVLRENGAPKLKILDVGAGMGDVGFYLLKQRPQAVYHFIELDEDARQKIQANLPAASIIDARQSSDDDYDVIFLNHVLEHTLDPAAFINAFKAKLRSGGLLYIEVPNRDDKFKGDVFPHTLFFSRQSLEILVKKTDIHLQRLQTFGRNPRPGQLIKDRIMAGFFHRLTKFKALNPLSKILDDKLFQYNVESSSGIWHGLLVRK